jgi:hydrogenase expression/formation protein HypE
MGTQALPLGKVPRPVLERLLAGRVATDGVLVGPGPGLDAAVLHGTGETPLVVAADPITFATDEVGWYAVHVNANDVACMGALPRWFLAVVLLPDGAAETDAERIFAQMEDACREVGAGLVGGHTEVTPGLDRPLVCGTMLGPRTHAVSAAGARPGDALLLTKGIAIEATALIARERGALLATKVDAATLERARNFLREPGLSILREARTALAAGGVHALHDPTEGGLVEGIRELCAASGTGATIVEADIPVYDETRRLAAAFDMAPIGAIASGALLMAAPAAAAPELASALGAEGIACATIGRIEPAAAGIRLIDAEGTARPLPTFPCDEIGKIFR